MQRVFQAAVATIIDMSAGNLGEKLAMQIQLYVPLRCVQENCLLFIEVFLRIAHMTCR